MNEQIPAQPLPYLRLAASVILAGLAGLGKIEAGVQPDKYDTNFVEAVLGDMDRDEIYRVIGALCALAVVSDCSPESLRAIIDYATQREAES